MNNENEQKQSDWKELEKWNAQNEAKMQENYGADITKLKEEKATKKIDKISKVLEKIVKAILILHVIVIIGIIVATAVYLYSVRQDQQSRPIFGGAFEE